MGDKKDIIKNNKIICSKCNTKNKCKRKRCYMCGKEFKLDINELEEAMKSETDNKTYIKKPALIGIVIIGLIIWLIDSQSLKNISLDKDIYTIGIYEESKANITTNLEDYSATDCKWIVEDNTIAKVDEQGRITGLKEGTTTITVKGNDKVFATSKVIVKYIKLNNIEFECKKYMEVGEKQNISIKYEPENASDKNIDFRSSNANIVSASDNGDINAVGTGKATITIKASDSIEKKIDIEVFNKVKEFDIKENSITIYKGKSKKINLVVSPKNAQNTPIKWISDNEDIAVVDSKGNVKGKANGKTIITAINEVNGKRTSIDITVKEIFAESIKVTGAKKSMKKGESINLKATISPNNTTDKSVKWTSSDISVATVDKGKVIAKGKGEVTITAETSNGIKKKVDIIVKEKAPIKITQFNDKMDMYGGVRWNINLKNTSKKTIDWLTIKWYCFDKNGNAVYDRYDNKNYLKFTFVDALSTLKPRKIYWY